MSDTVRTTVNLGKEDLAFVAEDAATVLDSDDYKSAEDFNLSKYVRRLISSRKALLKAAAKSTRKKKAA